MGSKLEPVIRSRDTRHIGIRGGVDRHTVVWLYGDQNQSFLASMGYRIFYGAPRARSYGDQKQFFLHRCVTIFSMVLRARGRTVVR